MAGKIFLQILNMSYTASYVIIIVLIARLFFKKAPKVFSYMLWCVVLIRLICPFSFTSIWSLIPEKTTSLTIDVSYAQEEQIKPGITADNYASNSVIPVRVSSADVDLLQAWVARGEIIWLIGVAVLLLYNTVSLLRLRWRLVGAVKLRDNIYLADHINTPFVIGIIRSKIYLPSNLSEQEQRYTILHEQTHIRRLDHIVKILAFAGLAIHWFNPLVWVAFILFGNDMEMSCDENVMKRLDTDIRSDYSMLLLGLATGRKLVTGVPLAFCEGDIKCRVKNVMNYKKPAFWVRIVTCLVVIVVVTGLVANPHISRATTQEAEKPSISEAETIPVVSSVDNTSSDDIVAKDNIEDTGNTADNDNKVNEDNDEKISNTNNSEIEDYAEEATLKYLNSPKGELLKQAADNFVKAYFSGDMDTIDQYLASDADFSGNKVYEINGESINVYDKLTHLLAKWYSASDETAEVQYEHQIKGQDSYTYMGILLEYSDGKWLVTGFYFEA